MKCVHLSLLAVFSFSAPVVGELYTFQFLIMADETDNCNKTLFLVQFSGTDTTAARTLQYKVLQTDNPPPSQDKTQTLEILEQNNSKFNFHFNVKEYNLLFSTEGNSNQLFSILKTASGKA